MTPITNGVKVILNSDGTMFKADPVSLILNASLTKHAKAAKRLAMMKIQKPHAMSPENEG